MRLSLKSRFALLTAVLVLVVASLVATTGYFALYASLVGQAERHARAEARQLAGLVDVAPAGRGQGNLVDITDRALTHELSVPGAVIEIKRPDGRVIQASRPVRLPKGFQARCLAAGHAVTRDNRFTFACERVGSPRAPLAAITVGSPLADAFAAIGTLRDTLTLGVIGGAILAALLAIAVARRAVRPIRQIADAAETIRAGDLGRRVRYRGKDELGALAQTLDACFAELEQAVQRQRRFGEDASHELRTPLAAIRAHAEMLRGWAATDPPARAAALASLDQASRRAERLVADLLYLAKLDREPPQRRAPVRLDEVVVGIVREATPLRPQVATRIVTLDEAVVNGDALALQQLLLNLVDNALRVSPVNGHVVLDLTAREGKAVVTVSDEGPGISGYSPERVFERFRTGPGRASTGSGLGLAIARAIALDHDGELSARNNPAQGATFELSLPLAAEKADAANTDSTVSSTALHCS